MNYYGKELILDLHNCNTELFTREEIEVFFVRLCALIDMERGDLYFWDYLGEDEEYEQAPPHLKGTSAIQFISTSNITIHTLDVLKSVYLNVFSCKEFKTGVVAEFARDYFSGIVSNKQVVDRL